MDPYITNRYSSTLDCGKNTKIILVGLLYQQTCFLELDKEMSVAITSETAGK
jgi:hypothetical protein